VRCAFFKKGAFHSWHNVGVGSWVGAIALGPAAYAFWWQPKKDTPNERELAYRALDDLDSPELKDIKTIAALRDWLEMHPSLKGADGKSLLEPIPVWAIFAAPPEDVDLSFESYEDVRYYKRPSTPTPRYVWPTYIKPNLRSQLGEVDLFGYLTLKPGEDPRTQLGDVIYYRFGSYLIEAACDLMQSARFGEPWAQAAWLVRNASESGMSLNAVLGRLFSPTPKITKLRDFPGAFGAPVSVVGGPGRLAIGCDDGTRSDMSRRWVAWERELAWGKQVSGLWRSQFYRTASGALGWPQPVSIAPRVAGPFGIRDGLSDDELQQRRAMIRAAFQANTDGPRLNLTYLEEAWYFLPVHLALQLQARGEYTSALDWFRTVYDYSVPEAQRKVYSRLEDETSFAALPQRPEDWLLDPLNPHLIAAARPKAYTRYTLLALIRCFLEYADAEFTRDTAESVPRARTLYMTALELLNAPELKQKPDEGKTISGTRKLAPVSVVGSVLAEGTRSQERCFAALVAEPKIAQSASRIAVAAATRTPAVLKIEPATTFSLPLVIISSSAQNFCVPPNPVLVTLRLRAELNLYKLRTCRNIAGMQRQLEPYAAPTGLEGGVPVPGLGGQLALPGAIVLQPT